MTFLYKILLAGEGATGKSTLVARVKTGKFTEGMKMTIGVDFTPYQIKYEGEDYLLQLWDLGGQERFQFMHAAYTLGAHGAILIHDLSRPSTAFKLPNWLKIVTEKNPKNLPVLLVGSKLDLVDVGTAIKFVLDPFFDQFHSIGHLTISSKTGQGVEEVFTQLVAHIRKTKSNAPQRPNFK